MVEIFLDQFPKENITKDFIKPFYINGELELNFLFNSDFNNAKYLREFVIVIFDLIGLEPIWKSRFTLIIDELNNNSIEHGSNSGDVNSMRIIIKKEEDHFNINIEVEDSGNGENSKNAKEMENLRKERLEAGFKNHKSIRGRGLFMIIIKLVDELYFKDSKNGGLIVGINKKI